LNKDIDDALEMSSKDVMEVLRISESTLYRWRKNGLVKYHYANSGDVRYYYKSLFVAIKCYQVKVPATPKEEALKRLMEFKDNVILNGYVTKDKKK